MPRKRIPVNELMLQDMIAGEISLPNATTNQGQISPDDLPDNAEVISEPERIEETKEIVKPTKKKKEQSYEDLYLAYRPIDRQNRQQVYVEGEIYEKFARFLKVVGDRKMSMSTFVNNILRQHWEANNSVIKQLYDNSMTKFLD